MSAVLNPAAAPYEHDAFARDVLDGLSSWLKSIPCKWLYDHEGSTLFERITAEPEYYPTRSEIQILERHAPQIAALAGPRATLIELGSGANRKTKILLAALDRPAAYVPVDLSASFMAGALRDLSEQYPRLSIAPLVADFTAPLALPLPPASTTAGRRIVFFPGATIGNLVPAQAEALLARVGRAAGPGALLVIGADHNRDPAAMVRAYDDAAGVTAAFNKNLLVRINRELQGDFDLEGFRHASRYNVGEQRVEMHLVARRTQRVQVLGRSFDFALGESIHTENAYKLSPFQFLALAHRAGWRQKRLWMDAAAPYAVHLLERVSWM
jgi:dimethylhistidine N-methyltransferase